MGSFEALYASPAHGKAANLSQGENVSTTWAEVFDSHGADNGKLISGDDGCLAEANGSSVGAGSILFSEQTDFPSSSETHLIGLFVRAP